MSKQDGKRVSEFFSFPDLCPRCDKGLKDIGYRKHKEALEAEGIVIDF